MNMVGLPPGMIITSSGETVDAEALVQIGGDRLAQRQDADGGRIAMMAVAQRLDRGLDDMIGGAEIRLADAQVDDVAALRRERGGARQHGESVFLADPVESRDGSKHGVSSQQCFGARSGFGARCARDRAPTGAQFIRSRHEKQILLSAPLAVVKSGKKLILLMKI